MTSEEMVGDAGDSPNKHRLVGVVVKASASIAASPGFDSRLCRGYFSGSSHISDFKIGTPGTGYPARRLALKDQLWHWLARCQFTVTG